MEYVLPFPDDSFDLVRLANLTLCIPRDRWEFVLQEVFRILIPGGRVEIHLGERLSGLGAPGQATA